jgi:hypothetical protein
MDTAPRRAVLCRDMLCCSICVVGCRMSYPMCLRAGCCCLEIGMYVLYCTWTWMWTFTFVLRSACWLRAAAVSGYAGNGAMSTVRTEV